MFRRPSDGVKKPGFCGLTLNPPCNNTLQRVALRRRAHRCSCQCSGDELATQSTTV